MASELYHQQFHACAHAHIRKMAEICHLENQHDVIFFCRWWSHLDKISQTCAEWHVDCGDMVKIETRCRIPIWRTFGRIQWHVIPEPLATLQGAVTWRIQYHNRTTLQGVRIPSTILKIVFRHIYLKKCSLGFDKLQLSYRLRYSLTHSLLRLTSWGS